MSSRVSSWQRPSTNVTTPFFRPKSSPVSNLTEKGEFMNHRQTISRVARCFPDLTRQQIEEILKVLADVWTEELQRPNGEILLRGFGKLRIEVQHIRAAGVMKQPGRTTLRRLYFRFRPTPQLRAAIQTAIEEDS